jgi:hypothetical protein
MDSLRQKENMEILDVFKNLHSQINGLTRKQVQAFPETLKPKVQRDMVAEVTTDKAIESLNRTLEQKLGALEFVVQNLEQGNVVGSEKQSLTQSFQSTINTGDLVPLWNSIVRSYKEIGLSRDSQNIIKVKIQDLAPNLDAMCYGLREAVEYIFQQPFVTDQPRRGRKSARELEAEEKGQPLNPRLIHENVLAILDFLRTLSVYQLVKQQVESGNLELLSVELMDSAYKNIFDTLSRDRVRILQEVAPRGVFGKSSIRNIPIGLTDYKLRLDALGEELGVEFPESYYKVAKSISQDELSRMMNKIRTEFHPSVSKRKASAQTLLAPLEQLSRNVTRNVTHILQAELSLDQLVEELRVLETEPLEEKELDEIDEVEEPVEPVAPRIIDFPSLNEYNDAKNEYDEAYAGWEQAYLRYDQIRQHNAFVREMREKQGLSQSERQQAITEKRSEIDVVRRRLHSLKINRDSNRGKLQQAQDELDFALHYAEAEDKADILSLAQSLAEGVKKQPINKTDLSLVIRGQGKPAKGKSIDTRGMATLRKNYGYSDNETSDSGSSSSESDEDPLNFDDRRNESYMMKPAR